MTTTLLVIHIITALTMIVLILLQRSEGGALGIGGGGGGGLMSGRSLGNALTRMTAILAVIFFLTSIALTFLGTREQRSTIIPGIEGSESDIPLPSPLLPVPELPTP